MRSRQRVRMRRQSDTCVRLRSAPVARRCSSAKRVATSGASTTWSGVAGPRSEESRTRASEPKSILSQGAPRRGEPHAERTPLPQSHASPRRRSAFVAERTPLPQPHASPRRRSAFIAERMPLPQPSRSRRRQRDVQLDLDAAVREPTLAPWSLSVTGSSAPWPSTSMRGRRSPAVDERLLDRLGARA